MKTFLVLFLFLVSKLCFSQDFCSLKKMKPADEIENIYAEKIWEESLKITIGSVQWINHPYSMEGTAFFTETK